MNIIEKIIFSLIFIYKYSNGGYLPHRSCDDLWHYHSIRTSGTYLIDVDGRNGPLRPFWVECDMSDGKDVHSVKTIIHHDSEVPESVRGFEAPGSYVRNISYMGTLIQQIEALIDISYSCEQFIKWDCKGATFGLWYPRDTDNWWVGRGWQNQYYWGGAETDSRTCGCFPNCHPTLSKSTCNCDANLKLQWLEDSGLLLDSRRLPVLQLRFGDTGESYEAGQFTLGPLICRSGGHKEVFMGSFIAPITIKSPGFPVHYPPSFYQYNWRFTITEDEIMELVFTHYNVIHFGAYNAVPKCKFAMEIVITDKNNTEIGVIKRNKSSPPYFISDGRETHISMTLVTCNQLKEFEKKGFVAELRKAECRGCSAGFGKNNSITECTLPIDHCQTISSFGYPFPHYIYGHIQYNVHTWILSTHKDYVIQIRFNDFDLITIPGQHYCGADTLTVYDGQHNDSAKIGVYCNINKFGIGTLTSTKSQLILKLRTIWKRVGNGRGFHATIRSISKTHIVGRKWVHNVAEGKPTEQSSVRNGQESSLAVDGIIDRRQSTKCSSTMFEHEPWWRVNLQKRHKIFGIQIHNIDKQSVSSLTIAKEQTKVSWPNGQYGLPMPVSGCPSSDTSEWKTGMRFHHVQYEPVQDEKVRYWSPGIMLKGGISDGGVAQHFCIRDTKSLPNGNGSSSSLKNNGNDNNGNNNLPESTVTYSWGWAPGKYCIFQYGEHCPDGFQSGAITWFDKINTTAAKDSRNYIKGTLPRGNYTSHNTTINFCCREDGNHDVPIKLPTDRPFYLLQYGDDCQEVEGMSEIKHYFHYEEEVILFGTSLDLIFVGGTNQLKFQDPHPKADVALFDKGMTLHYCYYDVSNTLKGFQVLVDSTPDTYGFGVHYDDVSGIAKPVESPFISAVECSSFEVTSPDFDVINLNCSQPIDGQYVIIFMHNRFDALRLCEVKVFGEESCGGPLGMATEEILDSAISTSSVDDHGLAHYHTNARLNSPKAWCSSIIDPDKYIQIDLSIEASYTTHFTLREVNSGNPFKGHDRYENHDESKRNETIAEFNQQIMTQNLSFLNNHTINKYLNTDDNINGEMTYELQNRLTVVGVAMQGMVLTFKEAYVIQFLLFFSNDTINWSFEEEPIGKQKVYKCLQCESQRHSGDEIVMYNLLKPIVTRYVRVKILQYKILPCLRLEIIGCRDTSKACVTTLTSPSGVISSPNYPFYYGQDRSCWWHIKPFDKDDDKHASVELDFTILDLAVRDKRAGKCYDSLTIYHPQETIIEAGNGISFSSIHKLQQKPFPKKIISSGAMSIHLKSCFRYSLSRFQGFHASYKLSLCPGCGIGVANSDKPHKCDFHCGRILSINYPLNYTNNHRNQWLITAPREYYINLTVEVFDIPSTSLGSKAIECSFDHVTFTDYSTQTLIGRFCNARKPPKYIVSSWNQLLIEFNSDSSTTGRGFSFTYVTQKFQLPIKSASLMISPKGACPGNWTYYRGYCYNAFFERESLQWYQAEERCSNMEKGRDGHLVSINDQHEMNVVHYLLINKWKAPPSKSIYIGLIDTNKEGFYNWSDGNPMSYTDWAPASSVTITENNKIMQPAQPDGGAFEDCTVIRVDSIHSTANWHDIPCSLGKSTHQQSIKNNTLYSASDVISSYICKMDSSASSHHYKPRNPLFMNVITLDEDEIYLLVDDDRYFVCDNLEVISNLFRCDGLSNCRDGSDEQNGCSPTGKECLESQYRCANGRCVAIGKYCDFVDDCGDGSDEQHCERRQCKKANEFKCNNEQCISLSKRCDLLPDCKDQSDEGLACSSGGRCNLNSTFQCYYGNCIPLYALCDRHRDCPGKFHEDEQSSRCEKNGAVKYMKKRSILTNDVTVKTITVNNLVNYNYNTKLITEQVKKVWARYERSACMRRKRKTCLDLILHHGITLSGNYYIQPDGDSSIGMTVECQFDADHRTAKTLIHHDSEMKLYVRSGIDGPATYSRIITYNSGLESIVALINRSQKCQQFISWQCSGSGFRFNSTKPISWWISRNGQPQYTWGGATMNSTCGCWPHCVQESLACNCDTEIRFQWQEDSGYIIAKDKLPVTRVIFGETFDIGQAGFFFVGPLECEGNAIDVNNQCSFSDKEIDFQCQSGQMIDDRMRCIYEFDQFGYQIGCRDVTHLRDCETYNCPYDYVKCPESYCIPQRYVCNGKWDCVGGADEIGCARYICPGQYKCANESSCILLHQLCDGNRHCPLGDDEWFCELTCPDNCMCIGLYVNCAKANLTQLPIESIPKDTRKLDLTGNSLGPDLAKSDFSSFDSMGELILVRNGIEVIKSRKFLQMMNLYKLDLRHNNIKILESGAFAGLKKVSHLLLDDNPQLTIIEPRAFVGLTSLRKLNISSTNVEFLQGNVFLQMSSLQSLTFTDNKLHIIDKGAFNELTSLVNLDLRHNDIVQFSQDIFNGLKSLRFLYTDNFKFCCLATSLVPFDRCSPPPDEISDCEDLMSSAVQRSFLWVLGVIAIIANAAVIIWRCRTRRYINPVSSTLILSLGCADFLMGIYLIIIATVDVHYRGRYIENADIWRRSLLCKFSGFLSTLSAEVSVATLVFITVDRLISICFPFSKHRFTMTLTYRLITISWIIVFLMASLPLFPIPYFNDAFYARSGVCLSLHITNQKAAGWEYSVAIFLCINLIAFLIIAACYSYMYKTIRISRQKRRMMARQVRETQVGRQMALIVITNFLCWCPVIAMGLMALAGVTIPAGAYSWTAVFVLPLNSATNPVVYSLAQMRSSFFNFSTSQRRDSITSRALLLQLRQQNSTASGPNIIRSISGVSLKPNKPPPGYVPLIQFLREIIELQPKHLLQISCSISEQIKDLHEIGYSLGGISFDNVFVSSHVDSASLKAYIPDHNAYRVNDSAESDDYAIDMEEFGLLVKRMLRIYHLRNKIPEDTEIDNDKENEQKEENKTK